MSLSILGEARPSASARRIKATSHGEAAPGEGLRRSLARISAADVPIVSIRPSRSGADREASTVGRLLIRDWECGPRRSVHAPWKSAAAIESLSSPAR